MVVFLLYGFVNMGVTWGTGTPVYPPLSWDSFFSWLLGLAMLPLALGYYFALFYLTRWKFRKLKMHDVIEYDSVPSMTISSNSLLNTL